MFAQLNGEICCVGIRLVSYRKLLQIFIIDLRLKNASRRNLWIGAKDLLKLLLLDLMRTQITRLRQSNVVPWRMA